MTSIPEPECSIILDAANVRRKINDYKIQTATVAQIFSTPDFDMANMLYSDEEWLFLHPIIDADGNALPATDRLPPRPDPLENDPSNALVTLHMYRTKISDTAIAYANAFKAYIIKSHGPDIASETAHYERGHLDISIGAIHNYALTTYGTLDSDDILFFQQELKRWDNEAPFSTNVARMRRTFSALGVNMIRSDFERAAALIAATEHVPLISGIVHNYRTCKWPD